MHDEDRERGFLSRWSRRKRQGLTETEDEAIPPEEQAAKAAEETATSGEAREAATGEPDSEKLEIQANLEAAQAVDLETLNYESDFEIFMKKGVPEALKNAAMQKLWRSNPALAVLDGLNDYDEDFADTSMNVFKSTWQVGRGFLSEDELHHKPADKAKAFLEKLLEDEHDKAVEDTVAGAQLHDDDGGSSDKEETEPSLEEAASTEVVDGEENSEQETVQPTRVSIRSRIFDYTEENG